MKSRVARIAARSARMVLSQFYGSSQTDRMDTSSNQRKLSESNHVGNHVVNHIETVSEDKKEEGADMKGGMYNMMALWWLLLWYFFSALTLFLNKYIIDTLKADAVLLGNMQMFMTAVCGFIQLYFPCGMYKPVHREGKPPNFVRNMTLVGSFRFATVFLGLVALKYVPVSFTETVKSSAPIFTVLIAYIVMREKTGCYTMLSVIPIMLGLALCSAYELSFNIQGFIAALGTNLTECFQNVYSKLLVSGDKHKYNPAELQFYTALASIAVQIPTCMLLMDVTGIVNNMTQTLFLALVFNGIFFHYQTITAYCLMYYISPVTHSVANTVKRAFLIWISVLIFGNTVTFLSGLGTMTVIVGVLIYNKAQEYDNSRKEQLESYKEGKPSEMTL